MTNGHLSDERIQEYLDGDVMENAADIRHHLEGCASCRKTWEQYRRLFAGLGQEPKWDLPEGFLSSLIQRVPRRRRGPSADFWIAIVALGVAACGILWALGPKGLFQVVEPFVRPVLPWVQRLAPVLKKIVVWLNGSLLIAVGAFLAVITAYFVDRYLSPRLLRPVPRRH